MELYVIAFIIDLIIGDPHFFPHPIKLIGHFINTVEKLLRKFFRKPGELKFAGYLLLVATIIFSSLLVYIPLQLLKLLGEPYYNIGIVYFSYAVLSTKCLKDEALKVKNALEESLEKGRKQVGFIVGRDTAQLNEEEVLKATIETVAENTTDGIIAPLLFLFLGGPVLAMAYKGVSTLDSMVGYKNEKYIDFGYASARSDDILGFIPARLAGFTMAFSTLVVGLDFKRSISTLLRDHDKHASPNSAWTEAAAAGGLNIQLGGAHVYFGKEIAKPTIGDNIRDVKGKDIKKMNDLMLATSWLFMSIILFIGWIIKLI